MRHGSIQKVDERNGSNTIQDNTAGTNNANNSKKFAVQDGLLFNAVREGENVAYTVQEINGVNTIIKRTEKADGALRLTLSDGAVLETDAVMYAIGRKPNTAASFNRRPGLLPSGLVAPPPG